MKVKTNKAIEKEKLNCSAEGNKVYSSHEVDNFTYLGSCLSRSYETADMLDYYLNWLNLPKIQDLPKSESTRQ